GADDDDRFVEHSALLEILEKPGDRLVDLGAELGVIRLDGGMRIPRAGPAIGAVEDLYEPRPFFDEPAGDEKLPAERFRDLFIEPVLLADRFGLGFAVDDFGNGGLHAERQLVGLD